MRALPHKLKSLREARALTQEELAAKCGLSRRTLQRIECGAAVRAESLAFVAAALGVATTEFTTAAAPADDGDDQGKLGLRRIRSGKHILHQLAQTDL